MRRLWGRVILGKFAIGLQGEKLVRAAASKAPTIVLLQIPGAVMLSDMTMSKISIDEAWKTDGVDMFWAQLKSSFLNEASPAQAEKVVGSWTKSMVKVSI